MSHELRTPLNAIPGFSQLLQRSPNASSKQPRQLATIPHSGAHLLPMINEMLDLAKIESGRIELNLSLEAEVARRIEAENALRQSLDRALLVVTLDGLILFSTQRAAKLLAQRFEPAAACGCAALRKPAPRKV